MRIPSRARGLAAAATLLAAGGGAVAVVHAQAGTAPPNVPVDVENGKAPAIGAQTINAGPTTFTVSTNSKTVDDDSPDATIGYVPAGSDPNALQKKILGLINGKSDPTEPIEAALKAAGAYIVLDGHADKGHPEAVTIDLKPGNYLALNTTADKKWYASQFTVGATPNGAVAPTPPATVKMTDYKFAVTGSLKKGQLVRFTNAGSTLHMAIPFKVPSSAVASTVAKKLKTAKNPDSVLKKYVTGEGKTELGVLSPGQSEDFTVADSPGHYLWICFFATKESRGKPHFMLGMVKGYTVS